MQTVVFYIINFLLQTCVAVFLITNISRIGPEDYRSRAFIRFQFAVLFWAAFDMIISLAGNLLPHSLSFQLYRYLSVMFIIYPVLGSILILSLIRPVRKGEALVLCITALIFYGLAIAFPDAVSASMFGVQGGYPGFSGPWNMGFKFFYMVLPVFFLGKLFISALGNSDPVIRKGQIIMGFGGVLFITGILVSQFVIKRIWPGAPWFANAFTLTVNIAGFIALSRYSRVLSSTHLFETMVKLSHNGLIRIRNGQVIWFNEGIKNILNMENRESLSLDDLEFGLGEKSWCYGDIQEDLVRGRLNDNVLTVRKKGNLPLYCITHSSPLEPGKPGSEVLLMLTDITDQINVSRELERANEALEELANRDGLTKIGNRRLFNEKLASEWKRSRRSGQPLSLIIFDVDFFKGYNDTYGHQMGDACLQAIARSVQAFEKRDSDCLCRIGGEEFGLILPQTDLEGAANLAEQILKCVEDLAIAHESSRVSDHVTISLGAAECDCKDDISEEVLYNKADKALYRAKNSGRNRVCV